MTPENFFQIDTRRRFLRDCAGGLGMIALGNLLTERGLTAASEAPRLDHLVPKPPHFPGTAKNVIFLFQAGAPSQVDLFDPKPGLQKWDGKPLPPSMTKDLKLAFIKPSAKIWASPRKFKRHGQSGLQFSDLLPHLATHADDFCMVRSMHTEAFNHTPGQSLFMTGFQLAGRPSVGAWTVYGLGNESRDLPAFVVLGSGKLLSAGAINWSSGFMPSAYQGVPFRRSGDPILYLSNPPGVSRQTQRAGLDALRGLNQIHQEETGNVEIASRIAAYELAFRMQVSAPGLLDFSDEPQHILDMYGVNQEVTKMYATNCLLARRMVERGVRFVMLAHSSWDDHDNLNKNLSKNCELTDQPAAALIKDLKQRGLFDSTLIVWGGEFGRTPMSQTTRPGGEGRDHHPDCFTILAAGGGIRGGQVVGEGDELGLNIVEDPVHINDLHATMLHCLGFDHTKLTYRHMGRDFRLTDVGGTVVKKMLA